MKQKYHKVAVGGTFDIIHKGHICLIKKGLELGELLVIGLTTDELLKENPKSHFVAKFEQRQLELRRVLEDIGTKDRVQIVPLNDSYGISITDEDLDALVVSYETAFRGREINSIRQKKGFKKVEIFVIDAVLAEDGRPISTTRIRNGEIDCKGHVLN